MLRFSLIICTRGRPHLLENLLLGIALLRYPEFELIIVCDPNDIDTVRCLARHARRAKIGHCATANLATARNIGLSMAQGDIAGFIDDDAVPEPDWLDQLAAAYTGPEITASGGFIRAQNGIKFQSRVVLIDPFGADHHRAWLPSRLPAGWFLSLTGTNFSVRRDFALALGGFDENYPYFLEETDFLLRLQQAGGEVRVADHAEVHHGYAANDRRTQSGAPKSLHNIARSKVYFCHINRRPEATRSAINRALARFMGMKTWLIGSNLLSGRLSAAMAARLLKELQAGARDAEALATGGRSLADFSAVIGLSFEPFMRRPPRQRICVLMKTAPKTCRQWQQIRELANQGYEVTAIYFGKSILPRVSFGDGIWQHRLSVAWPLLFRTSSAIAAELKRISARRGFKLVHIASEDPALQKAASASGLQLITLPDQPSPIRPK